MLGAGIERRIFVVGAPRSGTTLVQSLLAAHSRATSFTESHFFSRHFRSLPGSVGAILVRDPTSRVREFLRENDVAPVDSDETTWSTARFRWLLPLRTRFESRKFMRLLDDLAVSRAASIWIEKTPRHLRFVSHIEGVSDERNCPHFVHVIRKGPETVASLRRASRSWEQTYDLESCARRWNEDLGLSLRRIESRRDHFVFYEDLACDPEPTLERLLDALDLEWEPGMLIRYREISTQLTTSDETWKANVSRTIRPSATSLETLTDDERARVLDSLDQDLYQKLRERTA